MSPGNTDNQRSADGLGEPATFFGESNVAGREPKGGGLATNDETMVRGRKLRHGPRGQNGHLPETIGELRFVPPRHEPPMSWLRVVTDESPGSPSYIEGAVPRVTATSVEDWSAWVTVSVIASVGTCPAIAIFN